MTCTGGNDLHVLMEIATQCTDSGDNGCIDPKMDQLSGSCLRCLWSHSHVRACLSSSAAASTAEGAVSVSTTQTYGAMLAANAAGGQPDDGTFHVFEFALGAVSAVLLLVVAAVVARRARSARQLHAQAPTSEEDASKDDEKTVLTQAV